MGALLVFAATFGVYALTASPASGWLDSSELVAAAVRVGISHPPGHPLPTLLGRAVAELPVGDLPFRVNLVSALAAAAAAATLQVAARRLVRRLAPSFPRWAPDLVGAFAALGFAFTWSAWFQAVRAEVYALLAAELFVALAALLRFEETGDRRAAWVASFAAGLALATHPFVALLFLVPCAVLFLPPLGVRGLARVVLLGVLGLALLLYLPVRASRAPEPNWGDPDTAGRFVWTVSARAFQKSLEPKARGAADARQVRVVDGLEVTAVLLEQATPAVALLALLGLYRLLRGPRTRRVGLLLGGIAVAVAVGPVLIGFDPDNPDAHGYLLSALAALVLLAACGLAAVAEKLHDVARLRRYVPAAALLGAGLLPVAQAATHRGEASLRHGESSDRFAHGLLEDLAPRTLLLTSYFETIFQVWALQAVDGARPDVTVLDRSMLTYPGGAAHARERHPELARLVEAPLRSGRPTPLGLLADERRRRPVAFELHFNLDDAVRPYLSPDGWIAWFHPAPLDPTDAARAEAEDLRRWPGLAALVQTKEPRDRGGAARILLWNTFQRALHYCSLGRTEAAMEAWRQASALSPADPELRRLAVRCHLPVMAESPETP